MWPIVHHPDLCPLGPPPPGDYDKLEAPTVAKPSTHALEGDYGSLFEDEYDSEDEPQIPLSLGGLEKDDSDEDGDEDEDEAEIKETAQKYNNIINKLSDLVHALKYNCQYTDPHALASISQNTNTAVKFAEKIQKKEKLEQSSTALHLATFGYKYTDPMFIHTQPCNL